MASHFSGLEDTGFGFGFQIMILEATGFGFGFLNFKMEATGFGFGLGFLSPSWLRLRSHQPGFQPNPGVHNGRLSSIFTCEKRDEMNLAYYMETFSGVSDDGAH